MRKIRKTFITLLIAIFAVTLGVGVATMQNNQTASASNPSYTTKDVAMLARVAGWHNNENFEITFTLGECDWANESGQKTYNGKLKVLLASLDFFNKIKLGDKTLAEWGCSSCYDDYYWLNAGEPKYTLRIPLSMTKKAEANAAGIGAGSPVTILEGALIPSHAYLQGNASATVYRAGCEFESQTSTVAFGVLSYGKTDVEEIAYVQEHNGSIGYLGISLKGDDYLGDGSELVANAEYYSDPYKVGKYDTTILINGEEEKVNQYGLFNLGEKGEGRFSFQVTVAEENIDSITIPAGTTFPSRAMTTLRPVNNNEPVYIIYKTQSAVTFFKTESGWVNLDSYKQLKVAEVEGYNTANYFADDATVLQSAKTTAVTAFNSATSFEQLESAYNTFNSAISGIQTKASIISSAKTDLEGYKANDFRPTEDALRVAKVNEAKTQIDSATSKNGVETIVANAKAYIDTLKTNLQYVNEELAGTKTSAKSEIASYLNKTNYYDLQKAEIDEVILAGNASIDNALSENAIDTAKANAKLALDAILTKEEVVTNMKNDLNGYKSEENLYRAEQKATRDSIVATAVASLLATSTYEANAKIVSDAKAQIDALKTDAQLIAEELASAKTNAKAELDGYKSTEGTYRDEQAQERSQIIADAKECIDSATEITEIAPIVSDAKTAIDALVTDAELDAKEALEKAKDDARVKINEKKATIDFSKYSQENVVVINKLYREAKETIDSSTTIDEASAAATAFESAVNAVLTLEEESKGGCKGSVDGVSGVMAILTLCGFVFVGRKRK